MRLSDLSIKRPVLASVASMLIVVIGLAALFQLPVRELPDIDTTVISVSTSYPGAAPEIIDTEIVEVIEGALSGIDGILSISSRSRTGSARTYVEFSARRTIEEAVNDVRDAVGRTVSELPEDAELPQIIKADSDAQPIMRIAIISDRMSPAEITDYAQRFLVDRLSVLDGVAQIEIFGERRFAIRIWLDHQAMAARQITVDDIEAAIAQNNIELPAGRLESTNRQFTVRTDTRLKQKEEFEAIIVARNGIYPTRLSDIARVEYSVEDDSSSVRANAKAAVGLGVLRQSQANTILVSDLVRQELEKIRPFLPQGMEVNVASDDATFIRQSIVEVLVALGVAIALVILVILLFLHSLPATLIPALTIPVAAIGTFAFMYAFGFSLNIITLLALILAIGLVVDDAIVILENIQRRIEAGEKPLMASFLGARQVTFAVIATSITLCAVFVPISVLEGNVGRLFAEFGIVMAAAVAISTFVALSLSAMLASKLLREKQQTGKIGQALESTFLRFGLWYRSTLVLALKAPWLVIGLAVGFSMVSVWLYSNLPKELTPPEDRGYFFIPITAPQGATSSYTNAEALKIEAIVTPLREKGLANRIFSIAGFRGSPHRGFVIVGLVDWKDRDLAQQDIVSGLIPQISRVTGVRAFPVNPAGLGQRGSSQPLRIVIGGPNYESVKEWADDIVEKASTNPNLQNLETDFEATQPQISVHIDREKANDLGIQINDIGRTLQTLLSSREVSTFVDRGRLYPVILQAEKADRQTPSDLENIFVRSERSGAVIPLYALVSLSEEASSPELRRYNRLPSITVSASLAEGYDLGSAITYIQDIADDTLPAAANLDYAGQTRDYLRTSSGLMVTFLLAILIVFLVLAAQFESFVHPFIIMLSVPLAITGALASLFLSGMSLNVYSQIGVVLLVGLMAKNGILIVEFANQLRNEGKSVREAILEGAQLRFRPILMTVLSTILAAVPLAISTGAGAESRNAIGVVIIGGLGVATLLTLFLTPVLYDLLARFAKPSGAIQKELEGYLTDRK